MGISQIGDIKVQCPLKVGNSFFMISLSPAILASCAEGSGIVPVLLRHIFFIVVQDVQNILLGLVQPVEGHQAQSDGGLCGGNFLLGILKGHDQLQGLLQVAQRLHMISLLQWLILL